MQHPTSDTYITQRSTARRQYERHAGFTLLEVLVALVVVALSVAAVLHSASVAARAAHDVEERVFARWVGLDQLTYLQLATDFPEPGIRTGERELGFRTWTWEARISSTPEPRMHRVEMIVLNDRREQVITINGYLGAPQGGRF